MIITRERLCILYDESFLRLASKIPQNKISARDSGGAGFERLATQLFSHFQLDICIPCSPEPEVTLAKSLERKGLFCERKFYAIAASDYGQTCTFIRS